MRDLKLPDQRHPEKAHRPDQDQPKKPAWIRVKAPTSQGYKDTREILRTNKLVTVCEEAGCPNVGECWSQGHATMMIMGDICTRGCSFCNIATGKPKALDQFEPGRVAHAVQTLGLKHVVVTSVDRDDLGDGGAEHFAQTIRAIRHRAPDTTIEILTPDFLKCAPDALEKVVEARPDVSSITIWKPFRAFTRQCAQVPAISIRCVCCKGSRNWTPRCSPSRGSWWGSAKMRRAFGK